MPTQTLLERYVIDGGIMMVPLLLCSLLTIAFTLQGAVRLRRSRVMPPQLLKQARQSNSPITRRPFVQSLRTKPSPLARSCWFALKDIIGQERTPEPRELDALVDDSAALAADEMYDGLNLLTTVYTISPLLGLMGTILGMMKAFFDFGVRQEKSLEVLAVGIQEALVTTLWGIGIAITAFAAVQWLSARIRRYERFELPTATREVLVSLFGAPAHEPPRAAEEAATPATTSVESEA